MNLEISKIRAQFFQELESLEHSRDLENIKIKYLGRKGIVQTLLEELKNVSKEERPSRGKQINELKEELTEACEKNLQKFFEKELLERLLGENIDITLPGRRKWSGRLHPVTQMMQKAMDILVGMGFSIEEGPNLDSDYYNFESLNFAKDHPAREMQDTFFLSKDLLLRTHTSNVQVRLMEKYPPPIRMISGGRCFRNETISARSHVFFHQLEAFYIDRKVSFADLFSTMEEFWSKLFGKKIEMRFRPSYFPFVEPGVEGDIRCTLCEGKGCRLCKSTGWLEVVGAGMIHPEVLKAGGLDPEIYSGYAWGMGIERVVILQTDIKDIRLFWENDLRFLEQFP